MTNKPIDCWTSNPITKPQENNYKIAEDYKIRDYLHIFFELLHYITSSFFNKPDTSVWNLTAKTRYNRFSNRKYHQLI